MMSHIAAADAMADTRLSAVLVPLPEFGVVAVTGADAVTFLHSQLTSDVARLQPDRLQLSGYCSVKGRLMATFHLWRHESDALLLRMPREVVASIVRRLSMFVLRAKVKVVDASDAWTTYALIGPGAGGALAASGIAAPPVPWHGATSGGMRVDRMPPASSDVERFLLTAPAATSLPIEALTEAPSDAWWLSEIEAAVPTVFASTQEKFVPQMINFEVLGGVDFKKGCYPGQEIVARSQYLGKLKRRMNIAHADTADVPAGSDVFHSDGAQPVGTVVMAAAAPGGGSELLFEAPVDRLESGSLHIGEAGGPRLAVRPLPYKLFDPTA